MGAERRAEGKNRFKEIFSSRDRNILDRTNNIVLRLINVDLLLETTNHILRLDNINLMLKRLNNNVNGR